MFVKNSMLVENGHLEHIYHSLFALSLATQFLQDDVVVRMQKVLENNTIFAGGLQ